MPTSNSGANWNPRSVRPSAGLTFLNSMKLKISQQDPLGVLSSTAIVVEDMKVVSINLAKLNEIIPHIKKRFAGGLDSQELGFGSTGSLTDDLQLNFIENCVNFCFWPDPGKPKWEVEWPSGNVKGGWYGVVGCFKRALANKVPILDANFLQHITLEQVSRFFMSSNGEEIPLLEDRKENLAQAGKVLLEKFGGQIENLIKQADHDAIKITELIIEHFASYKDVSILDGREVRFLKRAQICANDFSYAYKERGESITNLGLITALADYKLPQVLREFGILQYSDKLAGKVDNYILIPHDSREEIEIRAATIWAIELLKAEIKDMNASEIDNTIWLMSQNMQEQSKPYHRTRTIYY
jgi:uncharacterized protein (DUF779 family)